MVFTIEDVVRCPYVRLSDARQYHVETAKYIINFFARRVATYFGLFNQHYRMQGGMIK